jgi:hypothetical protein
LVMTYAEIRFLIMLMYNGKIITSAKNYRKTSKKSEGTFLVLDRGI